MLDWVTSLPLLPAVAFLLVVIYLRAGGTYLLGRLAYRLADRGRVQALLASERVETALRRVHRWGAPVVALSFLTVGFQTAANFSAGLIRMPLRSYLPALAIGGFVWAVLYATIGLSAFTLWWGLAQRSPASAAWVAMGAALLVAGTIIGVHGRRQPGTGEPAPHAAPHTPGESHPGTGTPTQN